MTPKTRGQSAKAAQDLSASCQSPANGVDQVAPGTYSVDSIQTFASSQVPDADVPPIYRIDLSLSPRERYKVLAHDYKDQLKGFTGILNDLLEEFVSKSEFYKNLIKKLSQILLRRLYSEEETEELRGIHDVTGIAMHLLICFNVVLDSLMGCTSGGARVEGGASKGRMLHFRTVDWHMEPLRKIVVQLEFVDGRQGDVAARSITYVGFLGMLTGVRKGLSVSFNARYKHNDSTSSASNAQYYFHCLLVLLGRRPSMSHILRGYILSKPGPKAHGNEACRSGCKTTNALAKIMKELPQVPSIACYLTFSDGKRTIVMEKDRVTARIRSSRSFIAVTNHDQDDLHLVSQRQEHDKVSLGKLASPLAGDDYLEESVGRMASLEEMWKQAKKRHRRKQRDKNGDQDPLTDTLVASIMVTWPISNESTHYWCLMDPMTGEIEACMRYLTPLQEPDVS